MKKPQRLRWLFPVSTLIAVIEMSACALVEALPFGGDTWQEEVLLHDGSTIVVERTVKRGGRHEVGQKPSFKEQRLSFTVPGSTQTITWEDHLSQDLGQANFLPMALDIVGGTPYLVVYPMGCLSYNKWGRPNPPYVVFQYREKEWKRIPLQELPTEITRPNVLFSQPDVEIERFGKRMITADMIKDVIAGYQQPEFKTLLREPMKAGSEGTTVNCEEMVHYKCGWFGTSPDGKFNKEFADRMCNK
ncbi:MAG: hypothetical protein OJF47_001987 [Nitrospira sp.]|jgi:hypothetical protein|nr:MAG: hypothetical protein OJF47_001987 [Nitrospira sp.]